MDNSNFVCEGVIYPSGCGRYPSGTLVHQGISLPHDLDSESRFQILAFNIFTAVPRPHEPHLERQRLKASCWKDKRFRGIARTECCFELLCHDLSYTTGTKREQTFFIALNTTHGCRAYEQARFVAFMVIEARKDMEDILSIAISVP
jgi:hypothetical protein